MYDNNFLPLFVVYLFLADIKVFFLNKVCHIATAVGDLYLWALV